MTKSDVVESRFIVYLQRVTDTMAVHTAVKGTLSPDFRFAAVTLAVETERHRVNHIRAARFYERPARAGDHGMIGVWGLCADTETYQCNLSQAEEKVLEMILPHLGPVLDLVSQPGNRERIYEQIPFEGIGFAFSVQVYPLPEEGRYFSVERATGLENAIAYGLKHPVGYGNDESETN